MSEETSDQEKAEFLAKLRGDVGSTGTPGTGRDPVNQPMIRHWCDAMDDHNPNYTDPEYAAASLHGEIVAPPTMLNAWTMPGNIPRLLDPNDPGGGVNRALDAAGYVGVVATNSEHVYNRYLRLGDLLTGTQKLVDVSEEKHTGLGIGHFVTTETQYHNQDGEHVGSMFFRILKFKPGTGRTAPSADDGDEAAQTARPKRPRPSMNLDSEFFWEGARERELRIQRFPDGTLHHPPMAREPTSGSYDRGYQVMSGRGTLYSYAIVHHPQVPSFDYPVVVGLVELEEGPRVVSNVIDCKPGMVEVGMPLEVCWLDSDDDITLPQFRPIRQPRRESTLQFGDVEADDQLPLCPIPLTPTLIVATALASRDYQDVHHDRDLAIKKGSKDIFMNILTSSGLSGRYISDWAGPDAIMKNLKIRLGAPNYPYDTMTMTGSVVSKELADGEGIVQIEFTGFNSLGNHVIGTMDLALPTGGWSP